MCFKPCGELLYCKKWAESLTPGNKCRFLNCSRVENFFFQSPWIPTPKVFDRILGGEGGEHVGVEWPRIPCNAS